MNSANKKTKNVDLNIEFEKHLESNIKAKKRFFKKYGDSFIHDINYFLRLTKEELNKDLDRLNSDERKLFRLSRLRDNFQILESAEKYRIKRVRDLLNNIKNENSNP